MKMNTDEKHNQLMSFMAAFKQSIENIEGNIKDTNRKLDKKLEHIDKEISDIKDKIEGNQDKASAVIGRMDKRLNMLEQEMKSFNMNKEMLDGERRLDNARKPAGRMDDEKLKKSFEKQNGEQRMANAQNPARETDDDNVKRRKKIRK